MAKSNAVNKAENSFNNSIEEIIQDKTKFAPIAAYIQRLIRQYKLYTLVDIEEIFNEASLRGIKYVKKTGEEIKIPEAFVKRISLNIIREKQRKQTKLKGIDFDSYQETTSADEFLENFFSQGFSQAQIESLKLELKKLKPQDFELIKYSIFEEKSAKEIAELLSVNDNKLKESAIRKRKERILKKLREGLI